MPKQSPAPSDRRPSIAAVVPIAVIAAYRLGPHPWNVAPIGALFGDWLFRLAGMAVIERIPVRLGSVPTRHSKAV